MNHSASHQSLNSQKDVLQSKRVLLVEDNDFNRMVVKTMLGYHGIEVTEASNGRKAVEALQNSLFDLILMDVQMPVMDGLEATRFIRREISASVPIIALTASSLKSDGEVCFQAGMNDFLSKPFKEDELIVQVSKWLQPSHTVS